jgi:hypothetical protein
MCARGAIFPEAYDLQFVRVDPDFFFERQWYRFDACLERRLAGEVGVASLKGKARHLKRPSLIQTFYSTTEQRVRNPANLSIWKLQTTCDVRAQMKTQNVNLLN